MVNRFIWAPCGLSLSLSDGKLSACLPVCLHVCLPVCLSGFPHILENLENSLSLSHQQFNIPSGLFPLTFSSVLLSCHGSTKEERAAQTSAGGLRPGRLREEEVEAGQDHRPWRLRTHLPGYQLNIHTCSLRSCLHCFVFASLMLVTFTFFTCFSLAGHGSASGCRHRLCH